MIDICEKTGGSFWGCLPSEMQYFPIYAHFLILGGLFIVFIICLGLAKEADYAIRDMNYMFLRYTTSREIYSGSTKEALQAFVDKLERTTVTVFREQYPKAFDMMYRELIDGAYFDDMAHDEAVALIRKSVHSLTGRPEGNAIKLYEYMLRYQAQKEKERQQEKDAQFLKELRDYLDARESEPYFWMVCNTGEVPEHPLLFLTKQEAERYATENEHHYGYRPDVEPAKTSYSDNILQLMRIVQEREI